MISFTLATALAVRLTGGAFLATSGTVVVAIRISLALKQFNYNKYRFPQDMTLLNTRESDFLLGCTVVLEVAFPG
jgi:hypothetical protein